MLFFKLLNQNMTGNDFFPYKKFIHHSRLNTQITWKIQAGAVLIFMTKRDDLRWA